MLPVLPYSKIYDGKAATVADLAAKATATLNGRVVSGRWTLADDAPALGEQRRDEECDRSAARRQEPYDFLPDTDIPDHL